MSLRHRINKLTAKASGKIHVVVIPNSTITQDKALKEYLERGNIVKENDTVVYCIDRFGQEETHNEH